MEFPYLLRAIFDGVSGILALPVPGLSIGSESVTFGALFIAFMLASLGIALVRYAFGLGGGGDSPRTSSTNNPKIFEKRKGDEF